MEILSWSYRKRYGIKAVFSPFPNSIVFFRLIKGYYFTYTIRWSEDDPPVERNHLVQMEQLINSELGTEEAYNQRKSLHSG